MLGKTYLFLTPSKTDGRVPSQQDAHTDLQPDLLGSFPADIIGQFGCGHRAKFSPSVGVGGQGRRRGGGGGSIENWVWPKGEIHPFSEGGGKKVSDK